MTAAELVASIRPGDRVTIKVPAGLKLVGGKVVQEWATKTGTAKQFLCFGTHATLDMGGRYGTPGVATPANIIKVRHKK